MFTSMTLLINTKIVIQNKIACVGCFLRPFRLMGGLCFLNLCQFVHNIICHCDRMRSGMASSYDEAVEIRL